MPTVDANGLRIYYDNFGEESDPALILIAGLGSQCINYPDELCHLFAERGLRVVRFDNRDCGLTVGPPEGESYSLSDMGRDVVALMDSLAIESAHLWGSSMGGMIAQSAAIESPGRVDTLTSVQSTTGQADVGQPHDGFMEALVASLQPASSRDEAIESGVTLARLLIDNPDVFDEQAQRRRYAAFYDRANRPADVMRQAVAVMGAPDRAEGLASLTVPTLVMHGNRDRLIDISGGRRTAELVPDSRFVEIDGMGHDLSRAFWPRYVEVTSAFIGANVDRVGE